jgi:hypothetical protein
MKEKDYRMREEEVTRLAQALARSPELLEEFLASVRDRRGLHESPYNASDMPANPAKSEPNRKEQP